MELISDTSRRPAMAWHGLFICLALILAAASAAGADFLIPGVDLSDVTFTPGASVEYMVISEVYEVKDSSLVRLSVLGHSENLIDLEIKSSPWGGSANETVFVRVGLSDSIRAARSSEDVYRAVKYVRVKEGEDPFRDATEKEIRDFKFDGLFSRSGDSRRERAGKEDVVTPAGDFRCAVFETSREKKTPLDLGGNKALRTDTEESTLYMSDRIPVWKLARSVVTRTSRTEIASQSVPRGLARTKKTVLEAILYSYHGADDGG